MTGASDNVESYVKNILPVKIVENNEEFKDCKVIECKATNSKSLDGFASTIFQIHLVLEDKKSGIQQTLNLIAKVLKNDESYREIGNQDAMTINELNFYTQILPFYKKMLINAGLNNETDWTPKFYYGFYGFEKDFGDGINPEGVFVFKNLTVDGYRMGPRDKLDEKHMMLLTEAIAKVHALSYALKIQDREKFDKLVNALQIIPFSGEGKTMFDPFFRVSLERLTKYVESSDQEKIYATTIIKIRNKYILKPSMILQEFLDENETFDTIIHGDYNRNNVMFKYESSEGFDDPSGLKMFDFQWVKKASPALDLSFYMYMNLDPLLFESCWDKILKFYHETLITSMAKLLECSEDDERLHPFNFKDFMNHFSNYAFYGCLVSVWFLPAMLTDIEICKEIEKEITKDLFSEAMFEVCMSAGKPDIMKRVNENVKHAFDNGYIKRLLE